MTIGNRISELRKAKGFTQEYVADQLGVTRQAVSKWEQDITSPDTKNLIALSSLLDASIEYIATGKCAAPVSLDMDQIQKIALEEVKRQQKVRSKKIKSTLSYISVFCILAALLLWTVGMFTGIFSDFRTLRPDGTGMAIILLPYGHRDLSVIFEVLYYALWITAFVLMYIANKSEGQK